MPNVQQFGKVTVNYDNVPSGLLPIVQDKINNLFNDSSTMSLINGQTDSYTFKFGSLGSEINGFTSGNQGPNPVTTINTDIMRPDDAGGVVLANSYGVIKPFEVTALHEVTHVEFPDLSGDGPNGHDNPVGDYLFRTIVIDNANRLFGSHDTDENLYRTDDLSAAQQNPNFVSSGINLSAINSAAQAISLLRDNSSGVRQFLSPSAQDDQYDNPESSDSGPLNYKSEQENGNTNLINYDDSGQERSNIDFDANGTAISEDIYLSGSYSESNININIINTNADNIYGSNDIINLQGNASDNIGVFGQNQTVTGDSGNDGVNLGGDGTTVTVYGGGYVGLINNSQTLTLGDSRSTVLTAPGVQNETINGTNANITFAANASGNVFGQGDTINLEGNSSDNIGVFGQNQTVTGDSGNDGVNLGGDGTSVTVDGGGYVGLINNGQTLTLGDSGSTVQTASGVQNETINGSGEGITLAANSQANVNGSNDTIAVQGGDTLGVGGGNNTIVEQGSGGSVYVTGTNNATDQINVNGESVTLAANSQANVNGSNDTIAVQGGDTLGVGGGGNTIVEQGSGGSVYVTGTNNATDQINVNGESVTLAANSQANVNGSNDTIAVQGGDTLGVGGGGNTIVEQGSGGSVYVTGTNNNVDVINVSNETITLAANSQVIINGSGNTIDGTAGQDNITINGSDDHFSGNDDMVNFEGDIGSDTETGTNDSYFSNGAYIGGTDGSGGFDDPGDPGGGEDGDDWDPLVLNLKGGSVQTVNAANSPARFDLRNDGQGVQTGWGTAGEGYLVDTAKGNTTITDAADLVPSFATLQALDSNHDNKIDAGDASWSDLKVWVDGTGTAAFQSGSLRSLDDLGITAINLYPTPDRHLQNGNLILADGTFTWQDGSTGSIADVDFHTAPGISQQTQVVTTGTAAQTQIATQAAQLVSAMSTFGTTSAADTATPGIDKPIHIPLAVDPTASSQRHAV